MKTDWIGILTALAAPLSMVLTWLLTRHKSKREEWQQLYLQAGRDRDNYHDKWMSAEDEVDRQKAKVEDLQRTNDALSLRVTALQQQLAEMEVNNG